jgi:integrase
MNYLNFTKKALSSLALPPKGQRFLYHDAEVSKLALRVTSTGKKTFVVVKRVGGQVNWVTVGTFPDISVEQARAETNKLVGQYASGNNPAEARRVLKSEPTLTEFFQLYGERHGQNKLSWKDDQQRFRSYLQEPLGSKRLSEITRQMVATVLGDAQKAGKAVGTVRLIRALASHIFRKVVEWGYLEQSPVQGISVEGRTASRDRFLQKDELARFFAAVEEEPSLTQDFILLALLTGVRKANMCAMHWSNVDLDGAVWRIPRTKNGDPQNVPLSQSAIEILQARLESDGGTGFVFPGKGITKHFVDTRTAIKRVLDRAGIPYGRKVENGVTLHDLRRTFGSWQAISGTPLHIIGKSLNHKSPQATAIYARLSIDPVRESVNTATDAMLKAAGRKTLLANKRAG